MKGKFKPKLLLFSCCIIFSFIGVHAQKRNVSGTVTSADKGVPLAGVSVIVQGTSSATTTDEKGKYSFELPADKAPIAFSYTGYVPQIINSNSRTVINVTMVADTRDLSEVVVTAFGIEKNKKSLTYSTQVVDGSKLTEARETNVANSLKGRIAGLHVNSSSGGPGGSSFVMIRGNSSLTGSGQPLYVVDGVPIDNQTLDAAQVWGEGIMGTA